MPIRREKRSEICYSGVLVEHIWDTFDLVMLKANFGSVGALNRDFFRKYNFYNAASSTLVTFQSSFYICPCGNGN